MTQYNSVINSYKDSFESSLGAYVYMQLNQKNPEFFVVSSTGTNALTTQLEDILTKTTNLSSLIESLKTIPDELFITLQAQNPENDLTKASMLRSVNNLKYLNVDFATEDAWNELKGFIDYNNYSPYIQDKEILIKKLQEYTEKFSLNSFSLNPNFSPYEFLEDFDKGVQAMCEVLEIKPKQIGFNSLNLNYKTEDGDFTGYVHYDENATPSNNIAFNKMVINKPEVFAHELMHFFESNLGIHSYTLTELMDHSSLPTVKKVLTEYSDVLTFKETIHQKEISYSDISLSESVKSAAHFYERYALDSNSFYDNIEKISEKFEQDFKNGKTQEKCLEEFEHSIKELLQNPHPTRYFSFLKAQCDLYISRSNQETLKKNQYIDFAQRSDQYLQLSNYTESTIETFARSFEAFLHEKLKTSGKECSLVSSSYSSDFYPQGEMKNKINDLWEKMWPQIREGINKAMPVSYDANKKLEKSFIANNIEQFRNKFTNNNKTLKVG